MTGGAFIAVDWGTTNRRAYRIDGDTITTERDGRGAGTLETGDYLNEVAAMRGRMGHLPMLLAGMVGSDIGWHRAPYVAAPAGLEELAEGVLRIDADTAIVPGVSYREGSMADVMRGEEVQLLGAAASGLVPRDGLLCQPGTHCKWATIENGKIARFTTAMNGELFSLLRGHGLLARQLAGPVADGPSFREGVREGARRDLAASLFRIRAFGLLGLRDDADAAAFASGLIIGSDTAARLAEYKGERVYVLADADLGSLYVSAIETLGTQAECTDSHAAFVAGISRIWELMA